MFKPLLALPRLLPHVDVKPPQMTRSSEVASRFQTRLIGEAMVSAASPTMRILALNDGGVDSGDVVQAVTPIEVQPCVQMPLAAEGAPLVSHPNVER